MLLITTLSFLSPATLRALPPFGIARTGNRFLPLPEDNFPPLGCGKGFVRALDILALPCRFLLFK